ncbi:MAG: NAD(+)/NADH kinase [Christensenellales bacterium]
MKRIGIWLNPDKDPHLDCLHKALLLMESSGVTVCSAVDHPLLPDSISVLSLSDYQKTVGATLVFGGDGTMLAAARVLSPLGTGLIGINLGRRGFLTEIPADALDDGIRKLLNGNYSVDSRMTLSVEYQDDQGNRRTLCALNDIALSRPEPVKMARILAYIDGHFINRYDADALLVATPTGSTAYSLSAGGPILDPRMDAMLLTPVAPHSFSARPIIVPGDGVFTFSAADDHTLLVTADGQQRMLVPTGSSIRVQRSALIVKLLRLGKETLFDTLRMKLVNA